MAYTPHPDSLAGRVCAYFRRNPEEALSAADITIKFGADSRGISTQLRSTVDAGLLACNKRGRTNTYSAGSELLTEREVVGADALPQPLWPVASAPPKAARAIVRRAPTAEQVAQLVIDKDVPVPPPKRGAAAGYRAIAERMSKGDSVDLGDEKVAKAMCDWCRRYVQPTRWAFRGTRVWRTE